MPQILNQSGMRRNRILLTQLLADFVSVHPTVEANILPGKKIFWDPELRHHFTFFGYQEYGFSVCSASIFNRQFFAKRFSFCSCRRDRLVKLRKENPVFY